MISAGATGSETIIISSPDTTYDFSSGNMSLTGGTPVTYTINTADTITLGDISGSTFSTFTWEEPKEWVDSFPSWDRVKEMCTRYPGLEIALRNFETIYNLVKDDYDNPTPKK